MINIKGAFGYNIELINETCNYNQNMLIDYFENEFEKSIDNVINSVIKNNKRIIMLSGPSSSGKTTSSFKIVQGLKKHNISAHSISLDNFFRNKSEAFIDEYGKYDFESVNALDIKLIKQKLFELISLETSKLPTFNFTKGIRTDDSVKVTLAQNGVIIVEGIHALNKIIDNIFPSELTYKIYISVHSNFLLGNEIILTKRDARLIRRLIRDNKYRNSSFDNTLGMWENVCKGEDLYIRPNAKYADIRIDSTFPYEVGMLKQIVLPLLKEVPKQSENFEKAFNLINALELFSEFDISKIPVNSLLREFIGGGCYHY